jgi:hypothetical protein
MESCLFKDYFLLNIFLFKTYFYLILNIFCIIFNFLFKNNFIKSSSEKIGIEPTTVDMTNQYSNLLNYFSLIIFII